MAWTAISRSIFFDRASRITNFLGRWVKLPCQVFRLSTPALPSSGFLICKENCPLLTQQADNKEADLNESAVLVVMFKRINHNLPLGLSAESISNFFTSLFTFPSSGAAAAHRNHIMDLIVNPHYSVLAITVPMFSVDDPSTLFHYIVAAVLFTYDKKSGTFFAFFWMLCKR
jgi:hypothetical protein